MTRALPKPTSATPIVLALAVLALLACAAALAACSPGPSLKGTTWYCEQGSGVSSITFVDDAQITTDKGLARDYKVEGDTVTWVFAPNGTTGTLTIGKADGIDTLTDEKGNVYYQDRAIVERAIADKIEAERSASEELFRSLFKEGEWRAVRPHMQAVYRATGEFVRSGGGNCTDTMTVGDGEITFSCPTGTDGVTPSLPVGLELDKAYSYSLGGDFSRGSGPVDRYDEKGDMFGHDDAEFARGTLELSDGWKMRVRVGRYSDGVIFASVNDPEGPDGKSGVFGHWFVLS